MATAERTFECPEFEWVTDLSVRRRDSTRHHSDECVHFYPADSPHGKVRPRLATEDEMARIRPCKTCVRSAGYDSDSLPVGERPALINDLPDAVWGGAETDAVSVAVVRREQGALRYHLLQGRTSAPCGLCGRDLPAGLLVAAHLVPRRDLSDEERADFSAVAMLACLLGCDALFENGYLTVTGDGVIEAARSAESDSVGRAVAQLVGKPCPAFDGPRQGWFARHRELHLQTGKANA